jgi:hypothetical protein
MVHRNCLDHTCSKQLLHSRLGVEEEKEIFVAAPCSLEHCNMTTFAVANVPIPLGNFLFPISQADWCTARDSLPGLPVAKPQLVAGRLDLATQ